MNNWSSFTKRVTLQVSKARIYRAWATQDGLESWFLRSARFTDASGKLRSRTSYVQQGDAFEWRWFGHPDTVEERREVIEANGVDFLQFLFSGGCKVSVRIGCEEGQSILSLTQEDIPDDPDPATNLYIGCGEGWTFYLANLKSILEGGIDLRNRDQKIPHVINS